MSHIISSILSAEFLYSCIRVTTPLLFAALAALICNRGGILHIAFEGTMLVAAFCGVVGSALTQSLWIGLLCSILGGVVLMLILGWFNLVLKANIVLTAISLNILASGGTVFMLYVLANDKGLSTSLPSLSFPNIEIPIIKNIPFLGEVVSGHNLLTYVSFVMVIVVWLLIFKTPLGLNIRIVGESESAAESVGINVHKTKLITLIISGAIASLGGAYMSMGYLSWFARDMIAGRGFMGIAAQNLGLAHPFWTLVSSFAFGVVTALSNMLQTINFPAEAIQAIPYIATLVGLVFFSLSGNKSKNKK